MTIGFRNYTKEAGITEDYHKVREFLLQLGSTNYTYARWDWMITHDYLDKNALNRIGLWEDGENIVGVSIFDLQLGTAYCLTNPEYSELKRDMLLYSEENLAKGDKFGVVIPDLDVHFQGIAADLGFVATENKESDAIFYMDKTSTEFTLPEGYRITTMQETYDLYQYYRVLWKGFNHELNGEGEFEFTKENEMSGNLQMKRDNVDQDLKIAIVAPDGSFVSYCGMWYDKKSDFAVIEPVATDPDYRRKGLGQAAVLEGIRLVGELGAKKVLVGSSQQFYYSIGMRPFSTASEWRNINVKG
ncbi:GNAT family N-acetyltransferase [Gudongella sp. DL1XJH-153]|uniref:GNAT family N-acetyltransferase n=1 Tax=Gudongella sp. DL1XJH-153 TaxID=3409804 RepID=UPI003BB5316B